MFKVMIKAVYLNFWNNVPVMKRLSYLEPAKFKRFFWNPIRISGKTIDPLQIWNDKMYGTVDTPVYSEVPNNEKWSSFYHFPVVCWRISFVNARCSTDRESPSWSLAALMVLTAGSHQTATSVETKSFSVNLSNWLRFSMLNLFLLKAIKL